MSDIVGAVYRTADGTPQMAALDVYPVGLLRNWKQGRRWYGLRYLAREIRLGQWHQARQTLNGYLAEAEVHVPGTYRCGSGWTRRAAVRSWRKHARRYAI